MTVSEIFRDLAKHMLDGVMVHADMATYYAFLGFDGYSKNHEYQMAEEYCGYKRLCRYYMTHYGKIIPKHIPSSSNVIPENWYAFKQIEVDTNTKRMSVKSGLEKWAEWERSTKDLYQRMYKELCEIGEIAAAAFVMGFVKSVDKELSKVEYYLVSKKSVDYDIHVIESEQKPKDKTYSKMLERVGMGLC